MKIINLIIIITILSSCQPNDRLEKWEYCKNEIELLKGNYPNNADFDFNLSNEEQVKNLQKQLESSFNEGFLSLNGIFQLENSKIETLLITEWYCKDSIKNPLDEVPPPFLIRSKEIFINEQNKVLVDGQIIPIDALESFISKVSKDFFWKNSYKLVAYELKWDNRTENLRKFQVFEGVVKGYIQAANEISLTLFNAPLCELDIIKLEKLKKSFRFTYLIQKEIALPPPPPMDNEFEFEID